MLRKRCGKLLASFANLDSISRMPGPWTDHETRMRENAVAELHHHWGEAYVITWIDGLYLAQRRDTHATLRADTPELLNQLIRHDYEAMPVPRDVS